MQSPQGPLPFADVYRLYADRVYRFTLAMVRDPALAEDLTADVFVAAMRAYDRTQPDPDGLHLWLFRIAKNMVISHRRRSGRLARILDGIGRAPRRETSVEEAAQLAADVRSAVDALASLSHRDRLVVSMRIGGLSHAEIGSVMGLSEKTAAMAAQRAFTRLRQKAGGDD